MVLILLDLDLLHRFMYTYNTSGHRKHCCRYCLQPFSSAAVLARHLGWCLSRSSGVQAVRMAEVGSTLKFQIYGKQFRTPFVVHAEFQCVLEVVVGDTMVYINTTNLVVMLSKIC